MELKEAIHNRRTVRSFKPDPIRDQDLNDILEAGTWAPSHSNNQPWQFVMIGPEMRKQLLRAYSDMMEAGPLLNPNLPEERKQAIRTFAQNFGGAPLVFAVTCPPATTETDKYDYPLSAAAAIQNIFLAAWEKGIAGVWLSFGATPQARTMLSVPEGGSVAGILVMGYPNFIPPPQPRAAVSEKLSKMP